MNRQQRLEMIYSGDNRKIIYNGIRCPDGVVIQSKHRHHFVEHVQKDGRQYFVDGGWVYQRIGYSDEEFENLITYTDDPIEKIREHFSWVQRFDSNLIALPKPIRRKLKDISDKHLEALVTWTETDYAPHINLMFLKEQTYRGENSLTVPDYTDIVVEN